MKKLLCVIFAVAAVIGLMMFMPAKQEEDYLKLVVLANSNSSTDQLVKLKIEQQITQFVTPLLMNKNFEQAQQILNEQNKTLCTICKSVLEENELNYSINIDLEKRFDADASQIFDTLVVKLGNSIENNDFTVIYPPLNFVNNFKNTTQISFKSKIFNWFKSIFN